jgi:secondary thiamine-phosphate synthase enzyme
MLTELSIRTGTQHELVDITVQVQEVVRASQVSAGLCHLFVPHTTAGLTLNENWDPSVRQDILRALARLVPPVGDYHHAEGNSPAHIKATLLGFSATLPIEGGELLLGAWQGIYLAEFDGPRQRRVVVKVVAG